MAVVETAMPDNYEQAYKIYRDLFEELVEALMLDPETNQKYGEWGYVAQSQAYVMANYPPK